MRSRRPVLPRFGGALKTRPKATEIKVTFVPEEYLGGWGSGGRVPGLLSPHRSSQQRRDGLPSAAHCSEGPFPALYDRHKRHSPVPGAKHP